MDDNNSLQTPPPDNPQQPKPTNHRLSLQPLSGPSNGLPIPGLTPSNGVVLPGHISSQAQDFMNSNNTDVNTMLDGHRLFIEGTSIPNPELTTIPWPGTIAGSTLADKARMHHNVQIPFDYDAIINPQQLIREQQTEHDRPASDASDSQLENRDCIEEGRPAEANVPVDVIRPQNVLSRLRRFSIRLHRITFLRLFSQKRTPLKLEDSSMAVAMFVETIIFNFFYVQMAYLAGRALSPSITPARLD